MTLDLSFLMGVARVFFAMYVSRVCIRVGGSYHVSYSHLLQKNNGY